jgi:glutathione synthase/RimK-type ligase-like ATP-grasp enzyme
VALATCAALPGLDEDDRPVLAELAVRGIEAVAAVWDDADVDWAAFDLVVLRSTWDYAERCKEFLAWVESLPSVANAGPVVRWNTDKATYLRDLACAGVPVVPTRVVPPGDAVLLPAPPFVVKPAVSAGGRSSGRFDAGEEQAARELVGRIHGGGRSAILQPLVADERGETGLVYVGGRYSHAVSRRVPLPRGGARGGLYLEESVGPREATGAEREVAEAALAEAPFEDLLYARVDLLHDERGRPMVLEAELTEPSLYLGLCPEAAGALAEAIARRLA